MFYDKIGMRFTISFHIQTRILSTQTMIKPPATAMTIEHKMYRSKDSFTTQLSFRNTDLNRGTILGCRWNRYILNTDAAAQFIDWLVKFSFVK